MLQPRGNNHRAAQSPLDDAAAAVPKFGGGPAPDANLDGFWAYVRNKDIQTKVAPHNPDTFLLISAGPDGIFGTSDDIANFDHNGAELSEPQ